MPVTTLTSFKMGQHNKWIHSTLTLMCQDGKDIQGNQTKRGETMDKASSGRQMGVYILGDIRMAADFKERSMICNQITLTLSTMSSTMIKEKK